MTDLAAEMTDLLREILTELRAIREAIERQHEFTSSPVECDAEASTSQGLSSTDGAALAAIALAVGEQAVSAREILERTKLATEAASALRAALVNTRYDSPRKVGHLLRRCADSGVDGFAVTKIGSDRDGATWRVLRVSFAAETRKTRSGG